MAALLDVNAIVALVDSDHVGHEAIQNWFTTHHHDGWATCPLTENGTVRVLSQAAYPSGQRSPSEAIQILNALKTVFKDSYQFWPDDLSIADDSAFRSTLIAGSRQVTDVYLLGLAARHHGTLVSFDRSLAWQAVVGGSQRLVSHPR
jgi:hypothetical protein